MYLDHSGTTIPSASLLQKYSQVMTSNVYGNPHSRSHSSQRTSKYVDKARNQVLQLFNTTPEEYDVVFTLNTTSAVKLVAEGMCSAYEKKWNYAYSEDSHTSLIGLRELAQNHEVFTEASFPDKVKNFRADCPLLVSWPAQSNYSGVRFLDKNWHTYSKAHGSNVYTLLDIAALCTTHIPDLSNSSINPLAADFLCLSFYKIFGFPDLGALLIKKNSSAASIFHKRKYFGGGTVESLTINQEFAPRKASLSSQLEDGTIPFHSIIALSLAIDTHLSLFKSFTSISEHVSALANYTFQELKELKYSNGQPLCEIYSSGDYLNSEKQGPIVTFNLRDQDGGYIGYSKLEEIASIEKIDIRTGTMCNTGGSSRSIGYSEEDIISNHEIGHICGDDMDMIRGKPTGAIRVSLGAMSSFEDVTALIKCLQKYFLDNPSQNYNPSKITSATTGSIYVKAIHVYPIKSCSAFSVPQSTKWKLLSEGLKWDREFCIVSTVTGNVLSLKRYTEMANIKPCLDLDAGVMEVAYEGPMKLNCPRCIVVSLSPDKESHLQRESFSKLCGENFKITTLNSPDIVSFFSEIIRVPCTLARSSSNSRFYKPHLDGPLDYQAVRGPSGIAEKKIKISMTNSSPLLLLSESSVRKLNSYREPGLTRLISSAVFRGNIIIDGGELAPYAEDSWSDLRIGKCGEVYNVSVTYCDILGYRHVFLNWFWSGSGLVRFVDMPINIVAVRT